MPFGQASHPKKEPDGARRITADLHTVSPTLIFRWKYTLTGKNIVKINALFEQLSIHTASVHPR